MQLFEAINLDCLLTDPADLQQAATDLRALATYADMTARAMQNRLEGKIELANRFEKAAQAAFDTLPQWARW